MRIKAVLFDFDHTLVDSPLDFAAMRRGVLDVLAAAAAPVPADAERKLILEVITESLAGFEPDRAKAVQRRALDAIARVEAAAAAQAAPIDGVPAALAALRRDGRLVAIITRNGRDAVEAVLALHPLEHDLLLAREDAPAVKPAPEHAQEALSRLGVDADEALLVGGFRADMACALAAGITAVGVTTGRESAEALRAAGAAWVLPSVAALPGFLAERGW